MTYPEWKKVALQNQKEEKKWRKNVVSLQLLYVFPPNMEYMEVCDV